MCSRRKLVINGAMGVICPPQRSALRPRRRCRSSAPALPPGTSKYGQCPCGPCTSPERRSDARPSRAASSTAPAPVLQMCASDHECAVGVSERGRFRQADTSGGRCTAPCWRQSADPQPTKTRGRPSQPVGDALRGNIQEHSPSWGAGAPSGSYRIWYDGSAERYRAGRHGAGGRALRKCGARSRQLTRASLRISDVEAGTTREDDWPLRRAAQSLAVRRCRAEVGAWARERDWMVPRGSDPRRAGSGPDERHLATECTERTGKKPASPNPPPWKCGRVYLPCRRRTWRTRGGCPRPCEAYSRVFGEAIRIVQLG